MHEKTLVEQILREAAPVKGRSPLVYSIAMVVCVALTGLWLVYHYATSAISVQDQRIIRALAADISRMEGTPISSELDRAAAVVGRATYRDIRVVELGAVLVYLHGRVAAGERHTDVER